MPTVRVPLYHRAGVLHAMRYAAAATGLDGAIGEMVEASSANLRKIPQRATIAR